MSISHDMENKRFIKANPDGSRSYVQYSLENGTMDIYETFVPSLYRGRKTATELVRTAFGFAEGKALRVIPTCPFVAALMDKEPVYAKLRKKNRS